MEQKFFIVRVDSRPTSGAGFTVELRSSILEYQKFHASTGYASTGSLLQYFDDS